MHVSNASSDFSLRNHNDKVFSQMSSAPGPNQLFDKSNHGFNSGIRLPHPLTEFADFYYVHSLLRVFVHLFLG